jgi:peptidoglycan/LPS O-acetylase OafA/YrhL
MPPAGGEPALTGAAATERIDAPEAQALRPHYPCLEGLRTIGVMALFFQHTGFTTGLQARPGFSWMGHLELGPAMFFVLSAFLLYQPFTTANLTDRVAVTWRRFIKSRAFRVIPAYWVALTLLIIFDRANPANPYSGGIKIDGWKDALAVYGFAQVYFPKYFFHGITSAYTLDAEVIFYLCVPVYALLVRRWCKGRSLDEKLRRELYALAVVAVGSFAWRAILEGRYASVRMTCTDEVHARLACAATQWFPGYADYFALGMAVAAIASWRLARGAEPRWIQRIGALPDVLWLGALALFIAYSTLLGTHGLDYVPPVRNELRHFLNGAIVLLLLLPGVFGDQSRGGVRRFLRWRPIAYTGLVSYGVYLWHQGFTDKAMTWTHSTPLHANFLLITGIAVACSIATATVSWYWLERPINRRRDRPLRQWFQPIGSKS